MLLVRIAFSQSILTQGEFHTMPNTGFPSPLSQGFAGLGVTAFGKGALSFNQMSMNTAFGYRALYSNTTGFNNTAFGYQSLQSVTTSGNNTAFGYQSLSALTVGAGNTAFGYQAGVIATGTWNTFLGDSAGYSQTSGNGNTYVGATAGRSFTTGGANTCIGLLAGVGNLTGSGNTAVGYEASFGVGSAGANNTVIGCNAGQNANGGQYNTLIGYAACAGSSTIAIGSAAGNSLGLGGSSGVNNVLIGNIAGSNVGASTGQFNTVISANICSGTPGKLDGIVNGCSNTLLGQHNRVTSSSNYNSIGIGDSLDIPNRSVGMGYITGVRGLGDTAIWFNQPTKPIAWTDSIVNAGLQTGNDTAVVNTQWFVAATYNVGIYIYVKTITAGTINATINFYAEDGTYQSFTPSAFTNITTPGIYSMEYPIYMNPLRANVSITVSGTVQYYPTAYFLKIR